MYHSNKTAGAAVMSLVCAFTAFSALADERDGQVRTEDIMFHDLNLSTTAGVDTLYRRIHQAAERVCSVSGEPKLDAASASGKCTREAVTRAVEELDLPALTAFAANR